jgi:hypothetical protein
MGQKYIGRKVKRVIKASEIPNLKSSSGSSSSSSVPGHRKPILTPQEQLAARRGPSPLPAPQSAMTPSSVSSVPASTAAATAANISNRSSPQPNKHATAQPAKPELMKKPLR